MPYAFIQLVSRKEGMSVTDFKDRFENVFAPLMKEICGPVFPLKWVRRYIAHSDIDDLNKPGPLGLPSLLVGRREEIGWDCLGEMTFQDELHFQQYFARVNEEGPAERLLAAEKTFSDINKLKFLIMDAYTDKNEQYVTTRDEGVLEFSN